MTTRSDKTRFHEFMAGLLEGETEALFQRSPLPLGDGPGEGSKHLQTPGAVSENAIDEPYSILYRRTNRAGANGSVVDECRTPTDWPGQASPAGRFLPQPRSCGAINWNDFTGRVMHSLTRWQAPSELH